MYCEMIPFDQKPTTPDRYTYYFYAFNLPNKKAKLVYIHCNKNGIVGIGYPEPCIQFNIDG